MKELELKYGCNPNQKPSRIYMNDDRELPIKVLSGLPGCVQWMAAGIRTEESNRTSSRNFIQACITSRSSCWSSTVRDTGEDLLGR